MKEYLSSLISHGKQWHLKRSKIDDELMTQIFDITKNCRDDLNERVYWILNDIIDYPYCCQCNVQFQPHFYGFKNAYRDSKYCSIGCVNKSENHKSSIKVSYRERTGFEHPSQNPEFREKVDQINLEKYGDSNYFRTSDFKKKSANTNIERYGYASAMHNEEISIKNQKHRTKTMTLPSGKEISYQGYENVVINQLLTEYLEQEIIICRKEIPKIWYEVDGKKRRYYPDIWVPSQNLIIEVKSQWTYNKELERNIKKRNVTLELGYNFQFWICSDKEVLQIL